MRKKINPFQITTSLECAIFAHRGGAEIYSKQDAGTWQLRKKVPFMMGRMHPRDLGADRPGRVFDRQKGSCGRHGISQEHQKETIEGLLSKRIADELREILQAMPADKMWVAAEPHLLGTLRKRISKKEFAQNRQFVSFNFVGRRQPVAKILAELF